MAFCIECGAKVPDMAKFCPQCGTAVISVEAVEHQREDVLEVNAETLAPAEQPAAEAVDDLSENQTEDDLASEPVGSDPIETEPTTPDSDVSEPIVSQQMDSTPSVENSLAAAAETVIEPPKSKAGLFIGLGVLVLAAAGGGAYALGLFGGNDIEKKSLAATPEISVQTPSPVTPVETPAKETLSPVNKAYQAAISTGRISDLGNFARTYPDSSLAKDAELAALDSLNRQNSVLAFKAFSVQFPNADTSSYNGPRVNADQETLEGETVITPEESPVFIENETPQTINPLRYSITSRAEALEPFIKQGDTDYALSVIDEMLALTDLTEEEATFLLNLRAKAETAEGLKVQEVQEEPVLINEAETVLISFDTPATPVERFGAITPDEAVEPGECDVEFSVATSGALINIVPSCTQDIFIQPAIEALSDWTYAPASLNGTAVQQDGITVQLKFHLE